MTHKARSKSRRRPKKTYSTRFEARRLKRLDDFRRTQQLSDHQKLLQTFRDARLNADALESWLASMNPAYRSAMPDVQNRIQRLVNQAFHSRGMEGKDLVARFPMSYDRLREVVSG